MAVLTIFARNIWRLKGLKVNYKYFAPVSERRQLLIYTIIPHVIYQQSLASSGKLLNIKANIQITLSENVPGLRLSPCPNTNLIYWVFTKGSLHIWHNCYLNKHITNAKPTPLHESYDLWRSAAYGTFWMFQNVLQYTWKTRCRPTDTGKFIFSPHIHTYINILHICTHPYTYIHT